ncbi:MAG: T9SS type A sorting domain-containing protein [bacterium]|nr:T9SS type A sorting domain-containing protein [bacterium]
MIKRLGIALLLLLLTLSTGWATDLNVLFIGNSHTFFNNLPHLCGYLAESGGHKINHDQWTIGGYSLAEHAENVTTLAKIAEGTWDYVVLQEHSLYPTIDHLRDVSFFPAARQLDSLIAVAGAETCLFMTWGWAEGGRHCVGEYCSDDFPDYFAMQGATTSAYEQLADELNAFLVPAGNVWAAAHHADPLADLWNPDGYHPTPEGSYLAACVFYARFFGESPEGLTYYGNITPERALFCQRMAGRVPTAIVDPPDLSTPRLVTNYPNPFNPTTSIVFDLPVELAVRLDIVDAAGRRVAVLRPGRLAAGRHQLTWDAGDAPSGVYLVRLVTARGETTGKILLAR